MEFPLTPRASPFFNFTSGKKQLSVAVLSDAIAKMAQVAPPTSCRRDSTCWLHLAGDGNAERRGSASRPSNKRQSCGSCHKQNARSGETQFRGLAFDELASAHQEVALDGRICHELISRTQELIRAINSPWRCVHAA